MKMYEFRLQFHWNLFLGAQLAIYMWQIQEGHIRSAEDIEVRESANTRH